MTVVLLPGMDGTGQLFAPFLAELPSSWRSQVVTYPTDSPLDYAELAPRVRAACPSTGEFLVVAESFSGPLAILLAASNPPGLTGVVLVASFARSCRGCSAGLQGTPVRHASPSFRDWSFGGCCWAVSPPQG